MQSQKLSSGSNNRELTGVFTPYKARLWQERKDMRCVGFLENIIFGMTTIPLFDTVKRVVSLAMSKPIDSPAGISTPLSIIQFCSFAVLLRRQS